MYEWIHSGTKDNLLKKSLHTCVKVPWILSVSKKPEGWDYAVFSPSGFSKAYFSTESSPNKEGAQRGAEVAYEEMPKEHK